MQQSFNAQGQATCTLTQPVKLQTVFGNDCSWWPVPWLPQPY